MLIVIDTACLSRRSPTPIVRAATLGHNIAYKNTRVSLSPSQLVHTLAQRGFPVGALLDNVDPGTRVVQDDVSDHDWEALGIEKKCVYVDAALDVALPLRAFPHIRYFVYLNWSTRPVDVVDVRNAMAGAGMRVQQVSAHMLRFCGSAGVIDYYLNVRNLSEVENTLADFDAIFLSDRLPGEAMMRHGRAEIEVGRTERTPSDGDCWLEGRTVTKNVLIDNERECAGFMCI